MIFNHRNINIPMVLKVIGYLLMIEAAFMLVPAGVSLSYVDYPEEQACGKMFLLSAAITFVCAAAMTFGLRPHNKKMGHREGFMLTAVVWVFFSLFSMLPFLLTGVLTSVTDAFFESISGFTTTGSTLISHPDQLPYGIVIWRALSQWLGGMGIILFTLAVVPMLNTKGGIAMFNAEVTGITHERFRPRVSSTATYLWGLYFMLTVVMFGLLLLGPMPAFDAMCYTLSTVSTGGFGTGTSLSAFNSRYCEVIVMLFMFLGGVNFSLMFSVVRGNFSALKKSNTFKWYLGMIVFISTLMVIRVLNYRQVDNWLDTTFGAVFDAISAITSTGYDALNYEFHYGSCVSFFLILMCAMFFGAMAGSTSGGTKIDRLIVVMKNLKNEFYKMLHPNMVTVVQVDGKTLSRDVVLKSLAFLSLYLLVMVVVALALTILDADMVLQDAIFTSMSAISNVGYGHGITGADWSLLPDLSKWILSLEMLVGRLEVFTVLLLFTKNFWVKD